MKVVILAATLPAYRKDFFESLNSQLKEKDIEMTVMHGTSFFNKSMKFDETPGYKAIPLETIQFKFFSFDISWWKGIFMNVRKINPEMIIIHPGPGNVSLWFIFLYCYFKNITIGEWGSGYVRPEISGFKKKLRTTVKMFFLKRVRFILTYGSKWKNELVEIGFDESKIFVTHNTINVERILEFDFKRNANNFQDNTVFLFVGALIRQKNLDLAIKAISRLVRENYNIRYNIIGKGDIIDELKQIVANERMDDNIFILGPKYDSELSSFFINADVFLLPGTGGLAINEAMAYSLPIISTIGDGTVIDLLYEWQNGFYLEDKPTIENIYETCKRILKLNKSQLSEMGNSSKQIVSSKATLQHMVSNFVSAITMEISKDGKHKNPIWHKK
jgi:glycosyltransferase involved in cell wall biosynthesis